MNRKTALTFAAALTLALLGSLSIGATEAMADCYWPVYRSW
ncbi:hypothetical protein V8J82_12205 [Gymnodinialimonas sp. 2305UL16-5]